MGQIISYLYKMAATLTTPVPLSERVVEEIESLKGRSSSAEYGGQSMDLRASIGAERGQAQRFKQEFDIYKIRFFNLDILFAARYSSKLKLLTDCVSQGVALLETLKINKKKFTPELTDYEIERLESALINYFPQMLAKAKMTYMTLLKALDPSQTQWEGELQTILACENCYEQLQEKLPEYQKQLADFDMNYRGALAPKAVKDLFEYVDKALLEYGPKNEAERLRA